MIESNSRSITRLIEKIPLLDRSLSLIIITHLDYNHAIDSQNIRFTITIHWRVYENPFIFDDLLL